jgi:hypothetical protein
MSVKLKITDIYTKTVTDNDTDESTTTAYLTTDEDSIYSLISGGIVSKNTLSTAALTPPENCTLIMDESTLNVIQTGISEQYEFVVTNSSETIPYTDFQEYTILTTSDDDETSSLVYINNDDDLAFDDILENDSTETIQEQYYTYYFGIDDFTAQKRAYYSDSAFILENISVAKNTDVILVVEDNIPDGTSIEYSIIDGNNEYPIMPFGRKDVINEKSFEGFDTRFVPDSEINSSDSLFSVSYTVGDDAFFHYTYNESISVKIVFRILNGGDIPPVLKSLYIVEA